MDGFLLICINCEGCKGAHCRPIAMQDSVKDANEEIGMTRVRDVLLHVCQKRHKLLCVSAACAEQTI